MISIVVIAIECVVLVAILVKFIQDIGTHASIRGGVEEIGRKVEELERKDLLRVLAQTASQAEQSILHLTYTFRTAQEEPEMGPLLDVVKSKVKMGGVNVSFLGPDHKRLDGLYARAATGAEVKVNGIIHTYDTRFQVVDGRLIVITVGDPSSESTKGYVIESEVLGGILSQEFDALWNNPDSLFYSDYVKKTIWQIVTSRKEAPSPKRISERLCVPVDHVEELVKGDTRLCLIKGKIRTYKEIEELILNTVERGPELEKEAIEAAVIRQLSPSDGKVGEELSQFIHSVLANKDKSQESHSNQPSE